MQAEDQEVAQCAEVEEAVGVVAEGHQGDGEGLEVIGEEEEGPVEEAEEASTLVGAVVGVVMQTSRDLREAFEAGAHSQVKGVTAQGLTWDFV